MVTERRGDRVRNVAGLIEKIKKRGPNSFIHIAYEANRSILIQIEGSAKK